MMHKTLRGTIMEEAYIDLLQKLCARGTRGRVSTT